MAGGGVAACLILTTLALCATASRADACGAATTWEVGAEQRRTAAVDGGFPARLDDQANAEVPVIVTTAAAGPLRDAVLVGVSVPFTDGRVGRAERFVVARKHHAFRH